MGFYTPLFKWSLLIYWKVLPYRSWWYLNVNSKPWSLINFHLNLCTSKDLWIFSVVCSLVFSDIFRNLWGNFYINLAQIVLQQYGTHSSYVLEATGRAIHSNCFNHILWTIGWNMINTKNFFFSFFMYI